MLTGANSRNEVIMSSTESMEMYLETVYVLEKNHGHAHSVDIAKRLGVSKPSVTKAMNYLKDKGLILKENYGTITLTHEGRKLSENIYSKHKLISRYLAHSLNLSETEAATNACKMEHVLTDTMLDAICRYLRDNDISCE